MSHYAAIGPLRVLVVEDDANDVALIRHSLASAETTFLVDVVGWLNSAIHSASLRGSKKDPYDCALVDLYLPNGQGVDAAAEFMRAHPLMPVIVMAETRSLEVARQCVYHGAQDYVLKDHFDPDDLELAVLKAVARKHAALVNKALSRSAFDVVQGGGASAELVRGHVAEVDATMREVLSYLARNAPVHLPAARAILDRRGYGTVLYDVAESLEIAGECWEDETPAEGSRRARKTSDTALKIVRDVIDRNSQPAPGIAPPVRPSSPAEAGAIMLGVIERNKRAARGTLGS